MTSVLAFGGCSTLLTMRMRSNQKLERSEELHVPIEFERAWEELAFRGQSLEAGSLLLHEVVAFD